VDVEFGRTGSTAQALGIYYKIIKVHRDLSVPAVYEGMFGTS
jgi:hypothetical protein